jgi:hypothetical protein
MRIRTNKLKAPSPVTVLLICLIWPLAAVVGATVCDTEHTLTPPLSEHPINIAAQKPNNARDVSSDEPNVARYAGARYTDTKAAQ